MKNKYYIQLTPFFPSEDYFSGPYVYDHVVSLKKMINHRIIVIKVYNSIFPFINNNYKYTYQGIEVYCFKAMNLPSFLFPGLFQKFNLKRFNNFLKSTLQISHNDIEVIHAHGLYPCGHIAVDLGLRFKIRNFIHHHGLDVLQILNIRFIPKIFKKTYIKKFSSKQLRILNSTDLNIGVSQKVIDELEKIESYQNNNYVLHNGVNIKKFFKLNNIKRYRKDFKIGCIGNFLETKDQLLLLKAIRSLNYDDIQVFFIGTGPKLRDCKEYALLNHLADRVTFMSVMDHSKLNEFYNNIDLFVLPSYYEAFGCVYTEALSAGIPVIAIKNQGIEEVIHEQDKQHFLIDKKNVKQLEDLIIYHYKNRKKYDNYNFDIDKLTSVFAKDTKIFHE